MSYVSKNLLPGEVVEYKTQLHWKIYLLPTLVTVFVLAPLTFFALRSEHRWLAIVPLALVVVFFMPAYVRRASSEFAVTNKRVMMKLGVVHTRSFELLLGKVEAISVNQALLGKMLNYGDIVVTGSGGTQEPFADIQDPMRFRNAVQAVTDAQLRAERFDAPAWANVAKT